jgi:predicted Kef-type K+ transport protein
VVVASVGMRIGVLDATSYTIIIRVAIGTSLMAPPLLRYAVNRLDRAASTGLPAATAGQSS